MMYHERSPPRRTVLRGLGATLALPLLDAMVPALRAARAGGDRCAGSARSIVPMGMNMAQWTPKTEGPLELSPILQPLPPFRDRLVVLSGLDSQRPTRTTAASSATARRRGSRRVSVQRRKGADIQAGRLDGSVVAREFGQGAHSSRRWSSPSSPGIWRQRAAAATAARTTRRFPGARPPRRCRWRTTRAPCSNACSAPATAPIVNAGWRTCGGIAASSTP